MEGLTGFWSHALFAAFLIAVVVAVLWALVRIFSDSRDVNERVREIVGSVRLESGSEIKFFRSDNPPTEGCGLDLVELPDDPWIARKEVRSRADVEREYGVELPDSAGICLIEDEFPHHAGLASPTDLDYWIRDVRWFPVCRPDSS